ncbi:MAG: hypothetical protein SFX18_04500 [Pirellulales bacterium]|nr:hypothetical protein [Pirellulales bacterium]
MQSQSFTRSAVVILLTSVCWTSCGLTIGQEQGAQPAAAARDATKSAPPFTISQETTYITEPLNPNGYPDYVAAVNKELSKGVTPENNGAAVVLAIIDPHAEPKSDNLYKLLKVERPTSGYLQSYKTFISEKLTRDGYEADTAAYLATEKRLEDQFDAALTRPWTEEEFPPVAEWLKQQQPALETFKKIRQKDRWFVPLELDPERLSFMEIRLSLQHQMRDIACAQAILALREIGHQRYAQAAEVIADSLHWLRISQPAWAFIEKIINVNNHSTAHDAPLMHLTYAAPSGAIDVEGLVKLHGSIDKSTWNKILHHYDRMNILSIMCEMAQYGYNWSTIPGEKLTVGADQQFNDTVDFDVMLQTINGYYDRKEEILRLSTAEERWKAFEELKQKVAKDRQGIKDSGLLYKAMLVSMSKEERSRACAALTYTIMTTGFNHGIQMKLLQRLELQANLQRANLALVRYRAKHGKYPLDFAELKSEGIEALPRELIVEGPIKYKTDGDNFVLWSIGYDENDSGGYNGYDQADHLHDDYAVFSPAWQPKPPPKMETEDGEK